jgi:hypothetical protein
MGVDNLGLSRSMHSFLALEVLSADESQTWTYDVTFFFVGAVFGIATSAAVACNPSIPSGQERVLKREKSAYHSQDP